MILPNWALGMVHMGKGIGQATIKLTHVFPKEMAVYRATRGDERGTQ